MEDLLFDSEKWRARVYARTSTLADVYQEALTACAERGHDPLEVKGLVRRYILDALVEEMNQKEEEQNDDDDSARTRGTD